MAAALTLQKVRARQHAEDRLGQAGQVGRAGHAGFHVGLEHHRVVAARFAATGARSRQGRGWAGVSAQRALALEPPAARQAAGPHAKPALSECWKPGLVRMPLRR